MVNIYREFIGLHMVPVNLQQYTAMFMCFQYHSLLTLHCPFYSDATEQPYQIKQECQNITALSCNLTAETPSVHDIHYQAKVFVNGRFHGRTNRFKPLADSKNLYAHSCISLFHLIQMYSIATFIH